MLRNVFHEIPRKLSLQADIEQFHEKDMVQKNEDNRFKRQNRCFLLSLTNEAGKIP